MVVASCCGEACHLQGLGSWSGFSARGKEPKPLANPRRNLVQTTRDLRLLWRFTFQQNNDSRHTAKATLELFENLNV